MFSTAVKFDLTNVNDTQVVSGLAPGGHSAVQWDRPGRVLAERIRYRAEHRLLMTVGIMQPGNLHRYFEMRFTPFEQSLPHLPQLPLHFLPQRGLCHA